jgi:hypothetical protein
MSIQFSPEWTLQRAVVLQAIALADGGRCTNWQEIETIFRTEYGLPNACQRFLEPHALLELDSRCTAARTSGRTSLTVGGSPPARSQKDQQARHQVRVCARKR